MTPLLKLDGFYNVQHLYVKDESANHTGTFKDRLSEHLVNSLAQRIRDGENIPKTLICSISYGNTALSLATFVDQLNKQIGAVVCECAAFMPPSLSTRIFGPDSQGNEFRGDELINQLRAMCRVIELPLDGKIYGSDDLKCAAANAGIEFTDFIDVTEGLTTPAYVDIISEALEEQNCPVPDYLIVPFGAGVLCNEIQDYIRDRGLHTRVVGVTSGNPATIAIMLYGPIWVDTDALLREGHAWTRHARIDKKGRVREPYLVHQINDDEIVDALSELGVWGISAEPSAASGFALLRRLGLLFPDFDPGRNRVLVISTGNSVPYVNSSTIL
jgi:threonine dehydratase